MKAFTFLKIICRASLRKKKYLPDLLVTLEIVNLIFVNYISEQILSEIVCQHNHTFHASTWNTELTNLPENKTSGRRNKIANQFIFCIYLSLHQSRMS